MAEPFTDEDRARVAAVAGDLDGYQGIIVTVDEECITEPEFREALTRAVAHINHLEALRVADAMPTATLYERERRADALASARAALKGEDDG